MLCPGSQGWIDEGNRVSLINTQPNHATTKLNQNAYSFVDAHSANSVTTPLDEALSLGVSVTLLVPPISLTLSPILCLTLCPYVKSCVSFC